MEKKRTASIFPAFGCKYLGNEKTILDGMSGDLADLIARARDAAGFPAGLLDEHPAGDFTDELQSQYAVYLYSCALSTVLKRNGVHSDYTAGYSMGLYAALYHAESITFEQGLELIATANSLIRHAASGLDFGMGIISGLDRGDVEELTTASNDLEIINENNRHSFLIAGYAGHVAGALAAAKAQGALHTQLLEFHSPYHSRFMDAAAASFRERCSGMSILDPIYRIVSSIDQRVIGTADGVLDDLADNINHNINWHRTMIRMIESGVDSFFECGPGKSLHRMAKFIEGDFECWCLGSVERFLSAVGCRARAGALNSRR